VEAVEATCEVRTRFTNLSQTVKRTKNVEEYEGDRAWLIEQATAMTKTFAPYLGFRTSRLK